MLSWNYIRLTVFVFMILLYGLRLMLAVYANWNSARVITNVWNYFSVTESMIVSPAFYLKLVYLVLIQFAIMPSVLFQKRWVSCHNTMVTNYNVARMSVVWSLTGTTVTDTTLYMFHTVNGCITRVTGFILFCLSLLYIVLHFSLLLLL